MITLSTVPNLAALEKAAAASLDALCAEQIPVFEDRLQALTRISLNQGELQLNDPYSRALLGFAIADASYIALGARNALVSAGIAPPEIAPAIKASKSNLLNVSRLHEPSLRSLQYIWSCRHKSDIFTAPIGVLVVNTTPVTTVEFTEAAMTDINNDLRSGAGCPARGAIMDRFFDRFVDVVLA